jgi:hypothetical protein
MLFGDWEQEGGAVDIVNGELRSVDFSMQPQQDQGQGFEIIGSLSAMHSSFFRQATTDDHGIRQLRALIEPGKLDELIPRDYSGNDLPLWILKVQPSSPREG